MKGTYYKTPIVCKREQPFFNRQTIKFAHRQIIYYLCALIYKYYFNERKIFNWTVNSSLFLCKL